MATATFTRPALTPELQAIFDVMQYIDKEKSAPPNPGNTGRYQSDLQALLEALADSFDAYQEQRAYFFKEHTDAGALFATYGTPEPEQKKRTLINMSELRNRPRPQWVIENFFYEKTIIELYGEAGTYKSFLVFDWCARIATGTNWLDNRVKKQGTIIYIAAEGSDGYIFRSEAWCHHNHIRFEDLARNFWFWPEPLPLSSAPEVANFVQEVTEVLKENDQMSPTLVVIDTLLRCSNAGNINAPDVMGAIFLGAETIKRELQASNVLIVHHQGKSAQLGGMGSVVLKNNCDIIYAMTKDTSTPGQVVLRAEKMKDKPEPTTYLRTEKIYYGSPLDEDAASLVIVPGEKPCKEKSGPKLPKSQADILAILDEHKSLTYTDWWKAYETTGGKKRTFDDALKAVIEKKMAELHESKYRRYVEPTPLQEEQADID